MFVAIAIVLFVLAIGVLRALIRKERAPSMRDKPPAPESVVHERPPTEALIEQLFLAVSDQATDLLYYDRKEDEDLPRGTIEELIAIRAVTVQEIVAAFEAALVEGLGRRQ